MGRKRIFVVCPGRGSYTQDELGYLKRNGEPVRELIAKIDSWRQEDGQPTVTELDESQKFSVRKHTVGENASTLIHACAMADYAAIDRSKFEVVGITGNSMGWYLSLAASKALDDQAAYKIVNTMGSMMREKIVGGQMLYPVVDEEWQLDLEKLNLVESTMATVNKQEGAEIYTSIKLGGYIVVGGNDLGLRKFAKLIPQIEDRYPMKLVNHAAFHTPLLKETSDEATKILPQNLFQAPEVPIVDGRGHIWQPYGTDVEKLWDYTLKHQVYEYYDYSSAIAVALKEFAPDHLVLLGPGSSLGGATGQVLIDLQWQGLKSKSDFSAMQKKDPFLIAMGRDDQRSILV